MPSIAEQLDAANAAHLASTALEDRVRADIVKAFEDWDAGKLNAMSVRHRLENVVRAAYRTSANLAAAHTARMAEIPGWKPQSQLFNTDYLAALLADTRRNLREYKVSERDDKARRRHILRMQHSAGVGAQRGYTDALIASYTELEDFGYELRKAWLANFKNNVPCPICRSLHGTIVDLHDEFPIPTKTPNVYINLQGPPRHPRCQCYLVIFIITLENAFEKINIDTPPDKQPQETDTDEVKKLPWKVFLAIISALKAAAKAAAKLVTGRL
jgi:hypothetical protein